jgi:hypothetical protein
LTLDLLVKYPLIRQEYEELRESIIFSSRPCFLEALPGKSGYISNHTEQKGIKLASEIMLEMERAIREAEELLAKLPEGVIERLETIWSGDVLNSPEWDELERVLGETK